MTVKSASKEAKRFESALRVRGTRNILKNKAIDNLLKCRTIFDSNRSLMFEFGPPKIYQCHPINNPELYTKNPLKTVGKIVLFFIKGIRYHGNPNL